MLTTQSTEPPAGLFLEELAKARSIRDGERPANGYLPILYEFPDDIIESGAWQDPKNWPMVNPNMGRSVFTEKLANLWDEAKRAINAEGKKREVASQHFNVQIGVAIKSGIWKGAAQWEKNADPALAAEWQKAETKEQRKQARLAELADLIAKCEVVISGLDGGGLDDLFGMTVIGREPGAEELDKRRWRIWSHAWCQESVLDERQDIAPRLKDFEADGDLTIIELPGEDLEEIADILMMIESAGKFPENAAIGVDQVGSGEVIEEMGHRQFDISPGVRVIGIPQGWKLNGAIVTMERRLKASRARHNGSRLMNWVVGNCKIERKGSAISITKAVSGTAKIDPAIAMFDATALMSLHPEASGSVYSAERGLLVLGL
jgi:phage terminase large subunit-like protein